MKVEHSVDDRPAGQRPSSITVRYLRPSDIDAAFIEQWSGLEATAVEPNAYLSPSFALPAIDHLEQADDVYIAAAQRSGGHEAAGQLCGLAILVHRRASALFPLPHMAMFKSRHSYLTGMLLDEIDPKASGEAIVDHIASARPRAHGLHLVDFPNDGPANDAVQSVTGRQGWATTAIGRRERPVLDVTALRSAESWDGQLSANRRKKYRRSVRGLEEHGALDWHIGKGEDVSDDDIDEFLRLEHLGWKGEQGSSLLSSSSNRSFFDAAAKAFRSTDSLVMTQLLQNGTVIAATCNFASGDELFAFKIGWEPELSRHSPGIVNELRFLEHVSTSTDRFSTVDSGAAEDSFIGPYWPGRRTLVNVVIAFNRVGRLGGLAARSARRAKRAIAETRSMIAERSR